MAVISKGLEKGGYSVGFGIYTSFRFMLDDVYVIA